MYTGIAIAILQCCTVYEGVKMHQDGKYTAANPLHRRDERAGRRGQSTVPRHANRQAGEQGGGGACAGWRRWGCPGTGGRSQARKRAALWAVAWSLVRSGRVAVRTRVPRVDIAIEIKGERTGVKGRMLGGGFRALY